MDNFGKWRQFLTIGKTVLETWQLRHWLQFWQLRTWIQTIILTWQLTVTLDSIRNSCDVLFTLYWLNVFKMRNTCVEGIGGDELGLVVQKWTSWTQTHLNEHWICDSLCSKIIRKKNQFKCWYHLSWDPPQCGQCNVVDCSLS